MGGAARVLCKRGAKPTLDLIFQSVVNALVAGTVFSLVSVGMVLIYGVMKIVNFAHGAFYMVGAYTLWFLYSEAHVLPFGLAIVAAFVVVALLGLAVERGFFRPMLDNSLGGLINSLGILFILQVLAIQIGGLGLMKNVYPPYDGVFQLLPGVFIAKQRMVILLAAAALLGATGWFLTRTRLGWALRAVSQDLDAAQLQGINLGHITMIACGLGGGLAGIAGALMAPVVRVEPYMGHPMIVAAFIITVVAGLGSLSGAVIASFLYGIFHVFVATYFGGTLATILGLVAMAVVLVIKPTGLMGIKVSAE